jgi:hypothetical protein
VAGASRPCAVTAKMAVPPQRESLSMANPHHSYPGALRNLSP